MTPAQSPISWFPPRSRLTVKGCCIAIAVGAGLALLALAFKGTLIGWLVWLMFLLGALSCVWDFATRERR